MIRSMSPTLTVLLLSGPALSANGNASSAAVGVRTSPGSRRNAGQAEIEYSK